MGARACLHRRSRDTRCTHTHSPHAPPCVPTGSIPCWSLRLPNASNRVTPSPCRAPHPTAGANRQRDEAPREPHFVCVDHVCVGHVWAAVSRPGSVPSRCSQVAPAQCGTAWPPPRSMCGSTLAFGWAQQRMAVCCIAARRPLGSRRRNSGQTPWLVALLLVWNTSRGAVYRPRTITRGSAGEAGQHKAIHMPTHIGTARYGKGARQRSRALAVQSRGADI